MNIISGISSILAMGILTPVQSILSLIVLFISTSFCLYNQGFELFGIIYILIYVGAIAILFLFILSLLNIEYIPNKGGTAKHLLFIIILSIPFDLFYDSENIMPHQIGGGSSHPMGEIIIELNKINNEWASSGGWFISSGNELIILGNIFYTEYAINFIIISIILVVSIVGAITIIKC